MSDLGVKGILTFLDYLFRISAHHDWRDYEAMTEVSAETGLSSDEITCMLKNELDGTGVILDKKEKRPPKGQPQ